MIKKCRVALKSAYRFLKFEILYGTLLYRYGVARHQELLRKSTRSQSHTYTRFYRSPGQLEALRGPVMEHLLTGRRPGPFQIQVFASSNGAEAYTLASVLLRHFPWLDFQVSASDLHQEMVDHARKAVYSPEEAQYWATPDEFVAQTFDKVGGAYVVKPEIRARVGFRRADLLDPDIGSQLEQADLVFMQNVLCHLDPEPAAQAFQGVLPLLKRRSALFIDGMNLDLRETLTREAGLAPLNFKLREIHEFARSHVGERWWNYYYGIEPYATWHRDRVRRFSTIFLNEHEHGRSSTDASSMSTDAEILSAYLAQQRGARELLSDEPLLDSVLVDSEAIVDLLSFIEEEFDVELDDGDLDAENFESVAAIAKLVSGRAD